MRRREKSTSGSRGNLSRLVHDFLFDVLRLSQGQREEKESGDGCQHECPDLKLTVGREVGDLVLAKNGWNERREFDGRMGIEFGVLSS